MNVAHVSVLGVRLVVDQAGVEHCEKFLSELSIAGRGRVSTLLAAFQKRSGSNGAKVPNVSQGPTIGWGHYSWVDFTVNAVKNSSGINGETVLAWLEGHHPSAGKTAQRGETTVSQKSHHLGGLILGTVNQPFSLSISYLRKSL